MSTVPQTNVVGVFADPAAAESAAQALREAGFAAGKVGVAPQANRTLVTVEADGRHGEAAARLEDNGASGVQHVAR